ncbi:MAG: Fic family protein [Candidatus Omnitrophica bacterium]|nr:Fic family protein [Candidatus Omnitrophota bacterium]
MSYHPHYHITNRLSILMAEAEALKVQITRAPVEVAWLEKVRLEAMIKRAHFSTAIEGNPLTLPEVEALVRGKPVSAEVEAKREVLNYLTSLRWIARVSPETPITESNLLRLHKLLTSGLLPKDQAGRYKKRQNVIMSKGKVICTPPPPKEAHPLTQALLNWLEKEGRQVHPIIVSACAHYELARIHPFLDGNGRAARALATWILYRRGFDTQHLFAVDQFFKEDHEGYYEAIQQVRKEKGDLTSWLEYCAFAIQTTLERTQQRLSELALPRLPKRIVLTRKQERLLLELRERPGFTVKELERLMGVKRAQVYKILQPLVKNGVVIASSTRPTIYRLKES